MSGRPYDIAIVGGGIAGCAAALSLADSGFATIVIGPWRDGGERQGELLAPQAQVHLRTLGLEETFLAGPHRLARSHFLAWESALLTEQRPAAHADGPGHLIDRAAFARMLREAVLDRGSILQVGDLAAARHDGRMWWLTPSGGETIGARFVIDCSGRAAVVVRRHAAAQQRDQTVAAFAPLERNAEAREPAQTGLIEAVPEGWWQASLLTDGRIRLALYTEADALPAGLAGNAALWRERIAATLHLRRWLATQGYEAVEGPRIVGMATGWMVPAAGRAWLAAGDAAAAFDPLAAQGLTNALAGGRRAALAAAAFLSGDERAIDGYIAAMRETLEAAMAQRRTVYGRQPRWGNQPFWERRR